MLSISHTIAESKNIQILQTLLVNDLFKWFNPDSLITIRPFRLVDTILKEQFPEISKFRNVHQLDYATSGCFVLALNKKAAAAASKMFSERSVKKTYLALVNGHVLNDE